MADKLHDITGDINEEEKEEEEEGNNYKQEVKMNMNRMLCTEPMETRKWI